MAEGVIESKEEKKKLEKKKEEKDVIKIQPQHIETPPQADEPKKTEEVKEKLSTTKDETKQKLTTAKEDTEEKLTTAKEEAKQKLGDVKEDTEEKIGSAKEKLGKTQEETKQKLTTAKGDTEQKLTDVKEDARDKWGNVQNNFGEFKDETAARLEKYREESEKEGRNPAEKFLSDLIVGVRQKTGEVNQAVSDRRAIPINLPLTDVIESTNSITIISDITGLSKENIDVGISATTVEITALYDKEPFSPDSKFIQKERGYRKVHRVIDLPASIDLDKTTADYKNNILTISLPKKEIDVTKIVIKE